MNKIRLESHHERWGKEFLLLQKILQKKLKNLIIDIQHIGSSSIPGVIAKPILDVDIIIENKNNLVEIIKILEKEGYEYKGELNVPGRHAFRQKHLYIPFTLGFKKWMKQHLYVCFSDSLALKNHLLFKEALLNNENLRQEYSELKRKLIQDKSITMEEYSSKKTFFILKVLQEKGFTQKELEQVKNING